MFYISPEQLKESFDRLVSHNQKMNSFLGLLGLLLHGQLIGDNYWKINMLEFAKHFDDVLYLNNKKPTRSGEKYWYTLFQPNFTDAVLELILKEKRVSLQDCAIVLMWNRSFNSMTDLVNTFRSDLKNQKILDTCFFVNNEDEINLTAQEKCDMTKLQKIFGITSGSYTLGFDGQKLLSKPAGDISAAPFSQTLYAGTSFRKAFTVCDFDFLETYKLIPAKNNSITKLSSSIWGISDFIKDINKINLSLNNTLPHRFTSALQTKPFVILTGLSGSGKTKLAEAFSLWITENKSQTCMVAVGADWTNREPLLGFPNALEKGHYVKPESGVLDVILNASNDPQRPYFLILDEMNMSHVERYFADFLSAMESSSGEIALHPDTDDWADCDVPATISLPSNLFIIGTVNIDETTYMFSPKVLDRANVIEFRVSGDDMQGYFDAPSELNLESLAGAGASMATSFVAKANEKGLMAENLADALMPFFDQLSEVGAEFGYRTASEMSRFVKICGESAGDKMTGDEVIDSAIIQKLLPKLHGSRNKIEKVLTTLAGLCLADANKSTAPFNTDISDDDIKYPLSYEKLKRMHQRVLSDGFTSFAEA